MSASAPAPPQGPPPGAGLPAKVVPVAPNQTLYVRGLPAAHIQKADLRQALYMLFSTYGPVLDVVALKTMKMRGQAHIVYRDVQTATQAMRALDGFDLFGHKMQIAYAKGKSDIVAKLDGTFRMTNPSAPANVEVTELQQSIFNAPVPGSAAAPPPPPPKGLPAKPPAGADHVMEDANTPGGRGQKRGRDDEEEEEEKDEEEKEEEEEEEEEEDSDVAMEEDSDDE